jgi:hypothetical protein
MRLLLAVSVMLLTLAVNLWAIVLLAILAKRSDN